MKERWLSKIKGSEREAWLQGTWAAIEAQERFKRELILSNARALGEVSDALALAFLRATPFALNILGNEEFRGWFEIGRGMALRGWGFADAAENYFDSSPGFLKPGGFERLESVVREAEPLWSLDRISAARFAAALPRIVAGDPAERLAFVAGASLIAQKKLRSNQTALGFFDAGLRLLDRAEPLGFEVLTRSMDQVIDRNPDMAAGLMAAIEGFIADVDAESLGLIEPGLKAVLKTNWPQAAELVNKARAVLEPLSSRARRYLLQAFDIAVGAGGDAALLFWAAPVQPFLRLGHEERERVVHLMQRVAGAASQALIDFYTRAPGIIETVGMDRAEAWVDEGLGLMADNPEAGLTFFRLESLGARDRLARLSRGVSFNEISNPMRLYAEAVSSESVILTPMSRYRDGSARNLSRAAVVLPDMVDEHEQTETNALVYKLSTLHQAGHIEFGTYELFDAGNRERLIEVCRRRGLVESSSASPPAGMDRLFERLERPDFAAQLFFLAEDYRIDHRIRRHYPGVAEQMHLLLSKSLTAWPDGYRPSIMELLLRRISEFAVGGAHTCDCIWNSVRLVVEAWTPLTGPDSDVVHALDRAMKSYALVMSRADEFGGEFGEITELSEWDEAQARMSAMMFGGPDPGDDMDYLAPYESQSVDADKKKLPDDPVFQQGDYRRHPAEFGHKIREEIKNLEINRVDTMIKAGLPISPKALEQMAEAGIPLDVGKLAGKEVSRSIGLFKVEGQFLREEDQAAYELDDDPSHRHYLGGYSDEPYLPPLVVSEPYFYDEWDSDIGDHKIDWCALREELPRGGGLDFYRRTLDRYSGVIGNLRRQFQRLKPAEFQWMKAMDDGERIDLEAAVRAVADARAGIAPDQRVYCRRDKRRRDVAAAFLLDISASTDETIHAAKKKIIEIEKEACILLMEALESVGDDYGIFGFSGYGRNDVRVFPIKEFAERLNDRVAERLDAIKPRRSTRMGAPIRHMTAKLMERDARIRLLMLISDGRPEDLSYGKDDTGNRYGLEDTRMALYEARRAGVHPFGLNIDSGRRDYLGAMFGDIPYIIVDDVRKLPRRLPTIYGNITG